MRDEKPTTMNETDWPVLSLVQQPTYRAYLLRMWCESGCWRFSLEEVSSGKRLGFADIEALTSFIEKKTAKSLANEESKK